MKGNKAVVSTRNRVKDYELMTVPACNGGLWTGESDAFKKLAHVSKHAGWLLTELEEEDISASQWQWMAYGIGDILITLSTKAEEQLEIIRQRMILYQTGKAKVI